MLEILDNILLSDDVTNEFYKNYDNKDFKTWILSILPEVEDCKNQQQDNPWHIYSVLNHILHSVEEMNKQTKNMPLKTRRMLAYTMFLHDIGKPKCYLRRYSKLYDREVDSFFKHNEVSQKIAKRVLQDFKFNIQQRREISLLVKEHDIFMFITLEDDGNKYHKVLSQDLINGYIKQFKNIGDGRKLLSWLVKVGKADNRAQNPEMTKDACNMLDVFESMLLQNQNKQENEI